MYNALIIDFSPDIKKTSDSVLKIRCPHCFQIFKSFKNEFEEDYPSFHCFFCQEEFWISLGETTENIVLGHPVSDKKDIDLHTPQMSFSKVCPQCSHKVPLADKECIYCGVVFMNLLKKQQVYFQLRSLWEKVLRQWQNDNIHNDFLSACYDQNQLVYGITCYGHILKEDKSNTKAREILSRMKALRWSFASKPGVFSYRKWKRKLYRLGRKIRSRLWDILGLFFLCALFILLIIL